MKSLITVDVEGTRPADGSTNDPYGSVDTLDELLASTDRPHTLFVTPDVVDARTEVVRGWLTDGWTVGLHIHPARLEGGGSDRLSEYDRDAIEEFLATGCETFESKLEYTPTCFRAGRWEYSESLLEALDAQGFERDASLKPDRLTRPYSTGGVTEYPLSVYSNPVVGLLTKPWNVEGIPMHADAFLTNRLLAAGFYGATWRLVGSDSSYVMVSYHDYDVLDRNLRRRLRHYQDFLARRTQCTTLEAL
jgi:hypothetical protein